MNLTLCEIARALGGEAMPGGYVMAPAPGHSAKDLGMSVKLDPGAPDGFMVNLFNGGDPLAAKDYVRERCGLPPFKPNGGIRTGSTTTAYGYCDPATGEVRYHKKRFERADGPKSFGFYQQDGTKGLGEEPHLMYGAERLADLGEGQPVWIVEGEKKVDRMRELGATAVSGDSGASSTWLPDHAELLRGLPVIMWPDSDEAGERYISKAAAAILASNPGASIRVVRPFGPPGNGKGLDVCDWTGDEAGLADLAARAVAYAPPSTGQPAAAEETATPPSFARIVNPADWEGLPVPPREWIVPDYIPHKTVTLLSGDGGQGKSLLALQLAAGMAIGREWIGLLPEPGRTLILSAEDDGNEMHRRLDGVRKFYQTSWANLADIRLIDLVGEDAVLGELMKGKIEPTPMYHSLDAYMAEFKPSLAILDVLAELFGGQENDRAQVRQFIRLLKQLSRKHSCAIVLLSHPSLTGMNTGSGLSGSTGWNNAVRSRLYLATPKDDQGTEVNKNLRTLQGMKANYAGRGGKFDIEWNNGVFVRLCGPTGFAKMAAQQKADDVFLHLTAKFNRESRDVSPHKSASFAPTVFSKHADASGLTTAALTDAMDRLLASAKIKIETFGPPSHKRKRVVLGEECGSA